MATIVFSSAKGGVGKTTSAFILATTLAEQATVTLVDADPNTPLEKWLERVTQCPANLSIVSQHEGKPISEVNILEIIQAAEKTSQFVIVDLAGAASLMAGNAVALADLVIAPMAASQVEADEAEHVVKLVKGQEVTTRRRIPLRILFTRSPAAIRTRNMEMVQNDMRKAGCIAFENHLHDREAYRTIFAYGATLRSPGLDQLVSSVPKAIRNAVLFTQEVIETLRQEMPQNTTTGATQ